MPPPEDDDSVDELTRGCWLGGIVPIEAIIGRSGKGAVGARGLVAYPDGFELEIVAWLHESSRWRRGRLGHGDVMLAGSRFGPRDEDGNVAGEFVRFGVQFADGAKVTNLDQMAGSADESDPAHGIQPTGFSRSVGQGSVEFWIWPVPESGDIVLVCEWPAYDVPESRLTISGDELRAAAGRARPVWPDEPASTRIKRVASSAAGQARTAKATATATYPPGSPAARRAEAAARTDEG